MNRVAGRAGIVVILILFLIGGFGFFCVEYVMNSEEWILKTGSPHIYSSSGQSLSSMVMIDTDGTILLDTRDGTKYSNDASVRKASVHWVGDRGGNIYVRTLSQLTDTLAQIRLDDYNAISYYKIFVDGIEVARISELSDVENTVGNSYLFEGLDMANSHAVSIVACDHEGLESAQNISVISHDSLI